MKTNNIFTKCVVIAISMMVSANVNAQGLKNAQDRKKAYEAHIQDQREKTADIAAEMRGTAHCVQFDKPEVKNGLVVAVPGVRHPSYMIGGGVGATMLFNNANDEYGSSTVTSATAIVGMEYIFKHKEDAPMALFTRFDLLYNTKVRVENLETTGWGALASLGFLTGPCKRFHFATMAKVGYINRTSQRFVSNEVSSGNFDWNSNTVVVGGSIRFSYTIGYTKKYKDYNDKGQIITGKAKTPIDAFLEIGGYYDNVKKPKINGVGKTLNQVSGSILVGVNFGL